ncbi:hypothetical protein RJT34_19911 [Clitoria ternatea]|uniref:Protein kinase domain-containing protein n=1 Tax=Clitoria ternatea TaxID=43366 RepID=A0AAN9IS84_CLITE
MFYSQFILAKKGPLGTIWIVAHLERTLGKNQVADTDIGVSVEINSMQTSSAIDIKTFDAPSPTISPKPPPIDCYKSFDDDEFSKIPMVVNKPPAVKKAVAAPTNIKTYSVTDLQIATGSFSVDQLLGEGSFARVYRAQFDDGKVLNNNAGSGYEAPEVGLSGHHTLKSDIYSFGVVMLELISGRKPFDRYAQNPSVSYLFQNALDYNL